MSVLRRVKVFAGQLGLLAVLALVAALLVTGAPRIANDLGDRALREDIAQLPHVSRDITLHSSPQLTPSGPNIAGVAAALEEHRQGLNGPLPGLIGEQWAGASVGPNEKITTVVPSGPRTRLGLRTQTGVREASRIVAGRWPATNRNRVEVAVSPSVAETLKLTVDTVLSLESLPYKVELVVVGIFEAVDPQAPVWDDMELALHTSPVLPDVPLYAVAVTDATGLERAATTFLTVAYTWRYRIDEGRLDTSMLDPVATAVAETERTPPAAQTKVVTSLDAALIRFDEQLRAVQALLAVVQAGLLATLLGLVALAARLATERRREEFALLRARGGAVIAIGGRTLAESLTVLPAAVLAGWALGTLAPGRPAATGWLVLCAGAIATLAVPVLAAATSRRVAFVARRQDLVRHRPSLRRLTAELFVLVVAVLGAYLLRRRGLATDREVDPYLSSVPVLLAAGAALVALRIFPWPLRQVGRLATRARGAVAFLGLARAGRGSPVTAGPLAVLVIAITTGIFSGAVATGVDEARDRATDQEIPGDARLSGFMFGADTADRIAALPGVTAVTPMNLDPGTDISSSGGPTGRAQTLIVDPETLARVAPGTALPAALTGARPGAATLPAVVSPAVAAEVGRGGVVSMGSRTYTFTVGAVVADFPGLPPGADRFVVLPWQALPPQPPLLPNVLLVAGDGFDTAALRAAGDEGQRAHEGPPDLAPPPTEVSTWAERRAGLDRTGANEVLTFTFVIGAAGATALALFAVGFTVLAGAGQRGRALSRLRTMGLSARQGRGLLVYELVPLAGIAVLAGGLVGMLLPTVLGPALNLSTFSAGMAVRAYLDPLVVGAVLALVVATLAAAVLVENVINRRMRLGEVLRVGEENP